MKFLSKLLAPLKASKFFEEYWLSKPLIIKGKEHKFKDIFSWKDYNELLNRHLYNASFPSIRLAKEGAIIPAAKISHIRHLKSGETKVTLSSDKINRYCKEGATLIVDVVNQLHETLHYFASNLSSEIGEHVQINSYCSWKGTQGFDVHFDNHEVIIMQIEGSKHWNIYENIKSDFPVSNSQDKHQVRKITPSIQHKLQKGDLLYIPRGIWHSAIANEEPSLHLTIGINCRTRLDFLEWLLFKLSDKNVYLRKCLQRNDKINRKNNFYDKNFLHEVITEYSNILSSDNINKLVNEYSRISINDYKPYNKFSFPNSILENSVSDINIKFRRDSLENFIIDKAYDEIGYKVTLTSSSKKIIFRGDVDKFVQNLLQVFEFSGKDALAFDEDFSWEDIKPILQKLVNEQVLYILSN